MLLLLLLLLPTSQGSWPNWTPKQVCQANYNLGDTGDTDTLEGNDFENAGTVTWFMDKDDVYITPLRNEKAARQAVQNAVNAEYSSNGAAAYTTCANVYQSCNGQPQCIFGACVAEKLQFSW
jgi:hypothetical protein